MENWTYRICESKPIGCNICREMRWCNFLLKTISKEINKWPSVSVPLKRLARSIAVGSWRLNGIFSLETLFLWLVGAADLNYGWAFAFLLVVGVAGSPVATGCWARVVINCLFSNCGFHGLSFQVWWSLFFVWWSNWTPLLNMIIAKNTQNSFWFAKMCFLVSWWRRHSSLLDILTALQLRHKVLPLKSVLIVFQHAKVLYT